jgi:hypothetical protein
MISGAKNHQNNLDDIERTEREALEAMKNKEFPQVHPENIYLIEDNLKIHCCGSAVLSMRTVDPAFYLNADPDLNPGSRTVHLENI